MAKQSKFFRVAVEGATTDGRKIERNWLTEAAANYNRATYGARVNMEHIRGFSADAPFNAYGDVLALKAEEVEIEIAGKTEKRMALFAQIEPTDALVQLNAKKQKLYSSVEIAPDFAATGKAGLVGLAVTDSPASLGTEILAFAATQGDKNPFASKKSDPNNVIAAAEEVTFEFSDGLTPTPSPEYSGFFTAASDFFKKFSTGTPAPAPTPSPTPTPTPANDNFATLMSGVEELSKGMTAFTSKVEADVGKLTTELAAVKASIDTTEQPGQRRSPATGGKNYAQTDF